jgi:glucose-6-phosphate 1-dehydrogenase
VIGAFRRLEPDDVVLGQFEGYRDIDGVADDSSTETFAAARLWLDTERWRGVPFVLRTGKQLAASRQQVSLVFRQPDAAVHELPAWATS